MRTLFFFFFLLFCCMITLSARAQHDGTVSGRLQDTAARQPVEDATITVLDPRDSSLVAYSRSGPGGTFRVGSLGRGHYRLLVSHIGYLTVSRDFVLTAEAPQVSLGAIVLTGKTGQLAAVTVQGMPPQVSIHGDSIEFNAGSFRTKPDAVVEDLLKKLPGVQVDKNGTIKANGREVKKVLVDGKEFFGNDPKIATKNLPADAVDKVQVFDKKSDQAQFTGFDDGNSQQTINLTIKKDRKNGLFGKATAGYGADLADKDSRYDSKLNLNQFAGDRQLSVIGMANNTNKQGFTFQDILGFSNGGGPGGAGSNGSLSTDPFNSGVPLQDLLGNSQYITTTTAGGLNFNDSWRKHTDVNGNYFYNGTDDHIDERDARQNLLPGSAFTQDQLLTGQRHNDNQRLTLIADYRIDSLNSLKLTSALVAQKSNSSTNSIDTSRVTVSASLLNSAASRAYSYVNGYTWNGSALLRHRFAAKGRTLSATISLGLNSSTGGGSLYSVNHYYQPQPVTDTIDQTYRQSGNGNNYGLSVAYTEPLSRHSLLEFHYNYYRRYSLADKWTMDANDLGKYDLIDSALTNDLQSSYAYDQEGLQFRHQRRQWNGTLGLSLQQAFARNQFGYLSEDSLIRQSWTNLLPNANFEFKPDAYHNLRLLYATYTNPPTLSQLQPVPDNSDPLNIKAGNPALQPEYYHLLRLNYLSVDPFRKTSFFALLNYTGIHNRMVNDDRIDSGGVSTIRPVNFNGLYRTNAYLAWELPWRDLRSSLNVNSSASYDHSASLVNGQRNYSGNWSFSQGAGLSYALKEILDITAGVKVDYNDTRYSLSNDQNQSYWTESYTLEGNWYLPHGLSVASDLDYLHRSGLPSGYNSSPLIWNVGVAKQVFRNKRGGIRLQVFDILRQNTGISRNTNQNYIDDVSYRVLQRYFLVSFTYAINRFAGKSVKGAGNRPGKADIRVIH